MADISLELASFVVAYIWLFVLLGVLVYVFLALAFQKIASKTNVARGWLAWIPVANFFLYSRVARMHWWPILLIVAMPFSYVGPVAGVLFFVFNLIWMWKIFVRVKMPGWWALSLIIPIFGWLLFLILLAIAAWRGEDEPRKVQKENFSLRVEPKKMEVKKVVKPQRTDRVDRLKKAFSSK